MTTLTTMKYLLKHNTHSQTNSYDLTTQLHKRQQRPQ